MSYAITDKSNKSLLHSSHYLFHFYINPRRIKFANIWQRLIKKK